ncbi:MAG: DUF262 domain-containing protein [Methanospirillaceae archaeon]|nr:DUF262 domain-containing protein [Methanospirillaceae archaeon]
MKADNCSIWDLYNGAKQYVVPLFQRSYVWSSEQWETLWGDIMDQYHLSAGKNRNEIPSRFLGPVVVVREREKNLDKFTIIDGQQRIITISIILAVIRAFAKEKHHEELYEQVNDFLKNRPKSGEGRYIVIPTQADKETLYNIFDECYVFSQDSLILECFDFFWQKIDSIPDLCLVTLQEILTENFCVVYIELTQDENPNQVFESLNYRGVPLEESDLIRNFFFIRLDSKEIAIAQYEQFWKPMEERLVYSEESISDFLRIYCMKNGSVVRKGQIFEEIKRRYEQATPDEILALLRDLERFSSYYTMLVAPQQMSVTDSESLTIQKILVRLRLLGQHEIYPFLLDCFAWSDTTRAGSSLLSRGELKVLLEITEGYLIRRAVCRRKSHDYEKIFANLCSFYVEGNAPVRPFDLVTYLQSLSGPGSYPKNGEFEDNLRNGWLYHEKSTNAFLWAILLALEDFFASERNEKGKTDPGIKSDTHTISWYIHEIHRLRIEHIMPVSLSPWWREHLGSEWQEVHHDYLHRLGNLTLTHADNPAIADASFDEKREWYIHDGLFMNQFTKSLRIWKKFQIDQRSQIFSAFCMKIWPDITTHKEIQSGTGTGDIPDKIDPLIADNSSDGHCFRTGEIPKGYKPTCIIIRGTRVPVRYWYQVLEVTINAAYENEPVKFHRIVRKYQHYFSTDTKAYRSQVGVYSYHSRFGRYQVRDMCLDIIRTIGWNENEWCLLCS